jgi:hypothetical protein
LGLGARRIDHRDNTLRLARRKRQYDCKDHGRVRRIRSQDENAAWTEQGVRCRPARAWSS